MPRRCQLKTSCSSRCCRSGCKSSFSADCFARWQMPHSPWQMPCRETKWLPAQPAVWWQTKPVSQAYPIPNRSSRLKGLSRPLPPQKYGVCACCPPAHALNFKSFGPARAARCLFLRNQSNRCSPLLCASKPHYCERLEKRQLVCVRIDLRVLFGGQIKIRHGFRQILWVEPLVELFVCHQQFRCSDLRARDWREIRVSQNLQYSAGANCGLAVHKTANCCNGDCFPSAIFRGSRRRGDYLDTGPGAHQLNRHGVLITGNDRRLVELKRGNSNALGVLANEGGGLCPVVRCIDNHHGYHANMRIARRCYSGVLAIKDFQNCRSVFIDSVGADRGLKFRPTELLNDLTNLLTPTLAHLALVAVIYVEGCRIHALANRLTSRRRIRRKVGHS